MNGNRWNGKGVEYNFNGDIEFEGEYLNGKKWNGIVKEYNYEDDYSLESKGKIINGEVYKN